MILATRKIRLIMQLRSAGISDTAVLSAIEKIPREAFLPDNFRDQAYENQALPIGHGQTISQPQIVAIMTQALQCDGRTKVLEVGTGSGYQAAVLSRICRRVYTIERHRELLAQAEARFDNLRLHNITTKCGDGWKGWPEQAPFSRIMVTAAPPEVPQTLLDQLAPEGIMVIPVGSDAHNQRLLRITRDAAGDLAEDVICDVRFVPLVPGVPRGKNAEEDQRDLDQRDLDERYAAAGGLE